MAKQVKSDKWAQLLKHAYTRSNCEESSFIQVFVHKRKKNTDVIMRRIYEKIRFDNDTNSNLKKLYHEALYGNDKSVSKRIRDRIAYMRRDHK